MTREQLDIVNWWLGNVEGARIGRGVATYVSRVDAGRSDGYTLKVDLAPSDTNPHPCLFAADADFIDLLTMHVVRTQPEPMVGVNANGFIARYDGLGEEVEIYPDIFAAMNAVKEAMGE